MVETPPQDLLPLENGMANFAYRFSLGFQLVWGILSPKFLFYFKYVGTPAVYTWLAFRPCFKEKMKKSKQLENDIPDDHDRNQVSV
jgi:hypothetical protein